MDALSAEKLEQLKSEFASVTGNSEEAEEYLAAAGGNLQQAVSIFYGDDDGPAAGTETVPDPVSDASYTGPRTLDGRPAPDSTSSASSSKKPVASSSRGQTRGGLRTLKDLQGSSGPSHNHDDDDDDDDYQDPQDMFAGGEKSGLAVQNPGQADPEAQIRDILRRAGRNAPRPGGDDPEEPRSRFTGTGQTLGGDEEPSRIVTQPTPAQPRRPPREQRELHFWRNGFSVDDGPLYRNDDPDNKEYLEMIQRGQAPVQLMNAQHGQELDVQVKDHRDQDYVKPKAQYKPFSGSGQRLGSPSAVASSSSAAPSSSATPRTMAPGTLNDRAIPPAELDESQREIRFRVQFTQGGEALNIRLNPSHTVRDIYNEVYRLRPTIEIGSITITTAMPRKQLEDMDRTLGEDQETSSSCRLVAGPSGR